MRPASYRNLLIILLFAGFSLLAAPARWIRLRSANFDMYSSASAGNSRDTLRQFEQIRAFFLEAFNWKELKIPPVRLVGFGAAREYEPYKFNDFATAYYHETSDGDSIVMSHVGVETFPLAVHEYVHLLVRHAGLKLPPWLNEGIAEFYSTLRPYAGKILIGDLIAGRHQALLQEKWVPLDIILSAGRDSPYYNEKNKAGSLYNEGWALTHMLNLRAEYRLKFGEFVHAVAQGQESASAFQEVYGKTVPLVEKDLQSYLHGNSFQGALLAAKLDRVTDTLPAEPVSEFDTNLVLADLLLRPGNDAAYRKALGNLMLLDARRPEPYRQLGYLDWRTDNRGDAMQQFGIAFTNGDRNPKMLWDYGRLLEGTNPNEAIKVLSELLDQDKARVDVRLELAQTNLGNNNAKAAIAVLAPVQSINPTDSARFFRLAVMAHLRNGDQKAAESAARHFLDIAKSKEDRAAAELLVSQAAPPPPPPAQQKVETRAEPGPERAVNEPLVSKALIPRPAETVEGRFVELQCIGKQPRMVVETATGRKTFLIDDPLKVVITSKEGGTVDMTCGRQKVAAKITLGFEHPDATQKGIDGIVRTLTYQ